jgi:DNA-binding beta-propeller fold protein YncE
MRTKWWLIALVASVSWRVSLGQGVAPLKLVQTIPLPGVEGRIDHFGVDVKGQRLFMAALGNNTLEIIDLAQGKRVQTIRGLREPQGIRFAPELNRIFVANGGDGTLRAYDGTALTLASTVNLGDDADNVRYDSSAGQILVGYGSGAIATVDAKTVKTTGTIKLSAHPESFQLESSSVRMFVNVPSAGEIAVLDRKQQHVITTWPLGSLKANFPMALDEANHRLFVGTRNPARLVVFDSESGKQVTTVNCSGDTDDLFYDPQNKQIYLSAGEGFIDVFKQQDADHYQAIAKLPTAGGARTSLFVPELHRLYLAVPHRGNQEAAIRVYEVQH